MKFNKVSQVPWTMKAIFKMRWRSISFLELNLFFPTLIEKEAKLEKEVEEMVTETEQIEEEKESSKEELTLEVKI